MEYYSLYKTGQDFFNIQCVQFLKEQICPSKLYSLSTRINLDADKLSSMTEKRLKANEAREQRQGT